MAAGGLLGLLKGSGGSSNGSNYGGYSPSPGYGGYGQSYGGYGQQPPIVQQSKPKSSMGGIGMLAAGNYSDFCPVPQSGPHAVSRL